MKKFNEFMESLLVAKIIPSSDAVGDVTPSCGCENKPKDGFESATDDFMKQMGFDGEGAENSGEGESIQPTDNVGETGEIESSEESTSNVELECLGEEGLQIKFNGLTFTLPKDVVEAIKGFKSEGQSEENHEENESPAEETAEHAEGGSEENESETEEKDEEKDEENKNPFTESKKEGKAVNPWAVCNSSTGGKKKVGEKKFEKCVMGVKAKHPIKK